jgi:hypothetical protein
MHARAANSLSCSDNVDMLSQRKITAPEQSRVRRVPASNHRY